MKTIFNIRLLYSLFLERKTNPIRVKLTAKLISKKIILESALILLFAILLVPFQSTGQGVPNEAEWNGFGYSLKKVVSNTTIQSGVNFSYTIMFSAPAGATTINISDEIPTSLVVVSVPPPAPVNGITPAITTTGTPGVNEMVSYSLSGLPGGSASSGSFTIVVKFPEGVTCNGAAARNRAAILIDDKPNYTPFVSTTAIAVDPWRVVKSIISGPVVNPGGGACGYLMEPGDTVTYRLAVFKNSPYYGNVVGQQNMSSAVVTDMLPAGAIMLSSTCGIPANSTGTITWTPNSGNLNAATPYAYYYCDITVYYPAVSFPIGSFVYNQVDLDGTMCSQPVAHTSNETCIEIANIVPNLNGYFNKGVYLTNRVPGCQGYYRVTFCNTGNVALSAFNLDDVIPSGVSVDQVVVYGGNATTTMTLTANSGANAIAPSITSSYFNSGTLGFTATDLQLQMTGFLPVGQCIHMYIYFTVEPNPTGTIVENCASFDGLSNSLTLPDACISFTVDAGEPQACVLKDVCSPQPSYDPGDIVRFRLRIQNIGSADIIGASFQDNLHSNFTYVGNESYYIANSFNPACSSGGGIPAGTTAWAGVTPSHSGNNLNWSLPDVPSDCQLFYVGYCGYYGTWGLPYYFVEFDVMIDSMAMPGVTPNNYDISGGNLPGTVTSNTTNTLVVASFGQEVNKQVSTDSGTTFASSGTVTPGGSARYRLNYKNTSNVTVSSVRLVDLLPMNDGANDWLILNRAVPRGSQFSVGYNNNQSTSVSSGSAPSPVLSYAAGMNICLPPMGINSGCNPTSWGSSPDQNIGIDYGAYLLGSNVTISEDFDVVIDSTATNQQTACNDFAAISTADFLLDGVAQSIALTPIAAPPVCVTIDTSVVSSSCCDSIRIEQVSDAAGNDCCVRIVTDCEVKAITVAVTNGTISSTGWNCGTVPSGYVGQSSFTFAANNCVVDMTNCFTPDQTGTITVTYTINFQNGEECEKTIELDCGSPQTECCDSTTLNFVQDPDLDEGCCVRLVSDCEVDSIVVTIGNGTLSSVSWNCGTVPTGYTGQSSYTFDANLCAVDMITCVEPDQTGVVYFNYMIYFQNGEKCEKNISLVCDATPVICCDSIDVRQVVNADGTVECCAEIITKCEVDSIIATVSNGTFSSNTWSCGTTIPAAAVGQSSYTFVSDSCMVDMTNCIEADQTGVVSISYVIFFSNGETCDAGIQMDCIVEDKNCCDSVIIEQTSDAAGNDCCVKLVTDCEVESIKVNVTNGTISSANWNCGTVPTGFAGQSNYTFSANACAVEMTNCFEAIQSGPVTVNYLITFLDGTTCEKSIILDCKVDASTCCALVDFKLKQKWPHFSTQVGTFNITNLDPSSPICSVTISASPAATFTTGNLIIDGGVSTQSWNSTSIPASGSLSPDAVNSMVFSLVGTNYHGTITVCVIKCDGTECCFEFNWNKIIIIDIGIEIGQLPQTDKLVAVTVNPVVTTSTNDKVKYVSFGMRDEQEIETSNPEFFAISAAEFQGDEYPESLSAPVSAYMGKYNAFFELTQAKMSGENLGAFNLVFSNILPKLGCTLFDEDGNILFSGDIDVTLSDTVNTSAINASNFSENMFEFINLYPNPSNGAFNVTYATGNQRAVEIRVINPLGQVIDIIQSEDNMPGIHNVNINTFGLSRGLYKIALYSDGKIISKSAVIKK